MGGGGIGPRLEEGFSSYIVDDGYPHVCAVLKHGVGVSQYRVINTLFHGKIGVVKRKFVSPRGCYDDGPEGGAIVTD